MPRVTIIKTHFVVKNMHGDIQQSLTSKIKLLSTFGISQYMPAFSRYRM